MCISSRCGFRHYRHDVFLYRASYPWLLLRKALVGLSTGTRERNTGRPLWAVQAQTCQAGSAQGGWLAWALGERQLATKHFLPAFRDPAIAESSTRCPPPARFHSSCTALPARAPRLCGWRQGVQTSGVGGLAAPGVCMEVQQACVPGWEGRREEGGGRRGASS